MFKVLINAYAISPSWGSEQGVGWHWVTGIARYCEVFVITESEYKEEIELALKALPQGKNVHMYYIPVSERVRKMCWNQGDYRFYLYYDLWQRRALKLARKIVAEQKIDIIHQLNMVGYREPGQLWRIKSIPYIWGPMAGSLPVNLSFIDGKINRLKYGVKNFINGIQFNYSYKVRQAIRRADVIMNPIRQEAEMIRSRYGKMPILIRETGLDSGCIPVSDCGMIENGRLNLLWVGRFVQRKKLDLALRTISHLKRKDKVCLHIVGFGMNGEDAKYRKMAEDLGVSDSCVWYGRMENADVKILMRRMDVFFFTSVMELTSTVVPEAIQNRLPVLCHDIYGFGPLIDPSIGWKIPLDRPDSSVEGFASILDRISDSPSLARNMKVNFDRIAETLKYETTMTQVFSIYKSLTNDIYE